MRRLIPGDTVQWDNRQWLLLDLEGLDKARLRLVGRKLVRIALVTDHKQEKQDSELRALNEVDPDSWREAVEILNALRPLLERPPAERVIAEVDAVAAKLGKSRSTVYSYLKIWKEHGRASAFLRKERSDKGVTRLPDEVWEIIKQMRSECIREAVRIISTTNYLGLKRYRNTCVSCSALVKEAIPAQRQDYYSSRSRSSSPV